MNRERGDWHLGSLGRFMCLITLICGGAASLCAAQQNAPLLQITPPAPGSVVNPGQTISVAVTSPANASFSQVAVVGQDPIGFSGVQGAVPAQFSFTLPVDIDCRPYAFTAMGTTTSGQTAQSDPVLIDVERPDMPTALSAQMPASRVTLEALGEQFPIILFATFSDASVQIVTQSSYVTYSSSDTAVATVDNNGIVTGISAGTAAITATYTLSGESLQGTLSVTVLKQTMDVSPTTLDFGSQNVGTSSSSQQLTVTNAGGGAMKILSASATGDFSENDNCGSLSPLQPGGTCEIIVTFTPSAAGARIGKVTIANSFGIIASSIGLSGTGIGQPATSTTVTSSANPSVLGQSVTFTNSVTPTSGTGTPSGTVTFSDGTTTLATVALTNGQATFTAPSLAIGSHSITAAYSGDSNFLGSSSAALSQSVQYESAGTACGGDAGHQILQPINFDGSSVFKQGQTVPAKFRVCDANGNSIGSAGVVASFLLTQTTSGTVTTNVENIVDTNNPDTAFRFDATNQQWIFNISTQSLAADSTYVYTITLNDGTTISFQYGLR